ncbi:hypothetical protein JOD54_001091 [Actinokineospora baliensis]|uniref:recombination directionality factor n=1 Tax=Actinokineospora baliensis TaxID=547056 RepID=UPI001956A9E9|nr:hypothetical protein [Actinokineospora baliensis]MBM7770887.1 hypothetical protein [Actinokineospora baliensis]
MLRIYETDPDAKPRPRDKTMDDVVGRFRAGMIVGKLPQALSEWRVTTDDPAIAAEIAQLYGGEPRVWETDKSDDLEVMTAAKSVRVIIDKPTDLTARMVLYGITGPIHVCDGVYHVDGHPELDQVGQPCGCQRALTKRKEKARAGVGPKPDIRLRFRLADAPHLGVFLFSTGSWSLVEDLDVITRALLAADCAVTADLGLRLVEYTTKSGRDVSYHRPEFTRFESHTD